MKTKKVLSVFLVILIVFTMASPALAMTQSAQKNNKGNTAQFHKNERR